MKKHALTIWICLTVCFAAFTAGYFLGRNYSPAPVQLSVPERLLTTATTAATTEPETTEETRPAVSFPLDVNSATAEDLTALPGIGPVLAQRIVTYRESHGDFQAVEELLNVEGIGEKRMESIAELLTIGG